MLDRVLHYFKREEKSFNTGMKEKGKEKVKKWVTK
jgi:hypothetical protein